jgi:hypothetical protein
MRIRSSYARPPRLLHRPSVEGIGGRERKVGGIQVPREM